MRDTTGRRIHQTGVTVIELMVTLSIVVILLTVAVPGFTELIADTRRAAAVNQLIGALNMARNEAIKQGVRVTLCKTSQPETGSPACEPNAGWNQLWLLFVDNDHEPGNVRGTIDGTDQIMRIMYPSDAMTITTGIGYSGGISYRPNGVSQGLRSTGGVGAANGTFTLCANGVAKTVIINNTGRARVGDARC
jgi:type IV fimbrial biogenesis protein FimT